MRSVRAGVKRRLRDLATYAFAAEDVTVTSTWNGEVIDDSTLWLGVTEGRVDEETIGRQPLTVDRFTIDCSMRLFGFSDPDQAEAEAERLLNLFDATLRSAHRLTNVDGLDDGDTTTYQGVTSVRIADVDGPGHTLPNQGDTVAGWVTFTLDCTVDAT